MNNKRYKKYCLVVLAVGLVGTLVYMGYSGFQHEAILRQRMADVKALTDAYTESPHATNIAELIGILKHKGITLNNPVQKDKSMPCYLLVGKIDSNTALDVTAPLIRETNVTDARCFVESLLDGSVVARNRN
jgi:hypothetical protein